MADLIPVYFSPEEVTIVQGDGAVAGSLLELPWVMIFFTGSTGVGTIVHLAAAIHQITTILELGGKN
ncbi:aldehyde dehydrogenase family protein [Peribacillus sp. SI8-4]|uniref:aldehyde dehydrogenase family protein n=1 Tax=Peribacillus sp. SI8-4 TaxID=3048009 RepID=UPI00332BBA26